jgi:hypothetical protein
MQATELIVRPREGTLTRVGDPVVEVVNGKRTTCVPVTCDCGSPRFMLKLSLWIDGSRRPKRCRTCHADPKWRRRPVLPSAQARALSRTLLDWK